MADEGKTLKQYANFRKQRQNGENDTRVVVSAWRNYMFLNLRLFWKPADAEDFMATKQGTTYPPEAWDELYAAIGQAIQDRDSGLLAKLMKSDDAAGDTPVVDTSEVQGQGEM